ncbi:MAG: DEAD/DEAH box helicase [Phycisphaerales bacterium]|nr:DEAD/DEAH box helicase [Phycisphaerales bacterium]
MTTAPTYVLHACWSNRSLHLWAEDPTRTSAASTPPGQPGEHPLAVPAAELRARLASRGDEPWLAAATDSTLDLTLPASDGRALPSPRAIHAMGHAAAGTLAAPPVLATTRIPSLCIDPGSILSALESLADSAETPGDGHDAPSGWAAAEDLEFFFAAGRFVRWLLTQQRFVPMLRQEAGGELSAAWFPWLSDQPTAERAWRLKKAIPPSARAARGASGHDAWKIIDEFLSLVLDAECRRTLMRENMVEAIQERDPAADFHVAWLGGLLAESRRVQTAPATRQEASRRLRSWIGSLEERGNSSLWRLAFRLNEPPDPVLDERAQPTAPDAVWTVSFHLQSIDRPALLVDAADLWTLSGDTLTVEGRRIDSPQDLLLAELGRASRLYRRLEAALEESEPTELTLTTRQAYEFLREIKPILQEQGFGVFPPDWWDSPMARLGARLRIDSGEDPGLPSEGGSAASGTHLGMGTLVRYRWDISLGEATLTLAEFEKLAARQSPLVRVNGRWVEIRPEDVAAAISFIRENPGGQIKLGDAMRLAYASDLRQTGIPVLGMDADGWLAAVLNSETAAQSLKVIEPPATFHGTLRPYQVRGMSWMLFLERLGFGVCLADDMGLGKTIQLLALLAHEREHGQVIPPRPVGEPIVVREGEHLPTLLIVPMSVVGNWMHETKRFCPELKVLVHHGVDRLQGPELEQRAMDSDLVITTYALSHRDRDHLATVRWGRVVLDEAQYIKNPAAKQSQAARSFHAPRRVALTGTPVENRLSELWSIMEFLNPGYLGGPAHFRQRFAVPVERYRDRFRAEQLRGLVRPFILRRLKSDPTVVADLPEKIESREYAHLTSEQASLYESCVRRMLGEVDSADGIHRRGLVLSALIKLKQICNHPSQILKDHDPTSTRPPDPARSGKCVRLIEMLDAVLAEGDRALVFTQFRQMGQLLVEMLRHQFDREILFLHGGTPQAMRVQLIEQFQREHGRWPILLLSLKAGGVGLNLTAATHVFHFDRWWNPAVENQATDRAYRIGQTRTVQVHKFVVRGTLEERIDEMIEQKTELAQNIIGAGERWLTELSTDQLRDILALRGDAIGDEP